MRIADLYQQDDPVISFEFFPPKSDAGYAALLGTIEDLKGIEPGFVSVTMGAGGSTREKTVGVVKQIETEIGLTAMCHLPCVSQSRGQIADTLDELERAGVENVLALGGDPPRDVEDFEPPEDSFRYANELVEFIRSGPWSFSIGGGCYRRRCPTYCRCHGGRHHPLCGCRCLGYRCDSSRPSALYAVAPHCTGPETC